jgi:hypothetical protein
MSVAEWIWKILDILVKGLGVALISGGVTFVGYQMQIDRETMIQWTERRKAAVEFAQAQKQVDIDVAQHLLGNLLDGLSAVGERPAGPVDSDDLLTLRLVALNFQDVPVNLKPIFEEFDERLKKNARAEELRKKLYKIAKEVANRQAYRMTVLDKDSYDEHILLDATKVGESVPLKYGLKVRINELAQDSVDITLIRNDEESASFNAGIFDMPIVDNLKLFEKIRVAVLFVPPKETNGGSDPELRLIIFRSDLASDRFDLKELAREFIRDASDRPSPAPQPNALGQFRDWLFGAGNASG